MVARLRSRKFSSLEYRWMSSGDAIRLRAWRLRRMFGSRFCYQRAVHPRSPISATSKVSESSTHCPTYSHAISSVYQTPYKVSMQRSSQPRKVSACQPAMLDEWKAECLGCLVGCIIEGILEGIRMTGLSSGKMGWLARRNLRRLLAG